jgi:hypothetical protein
LFLAPPVLCQDSQTQPSAEPPSASNQSQKTAPNQPFPQNTPDAQKGQSPKKQKSKDDRMFYVMPNYLTVDNQSEVPPLTWKQKFSTTAQGAFDPYEFAVVGILSGIRQAENAYPAFGQGMSGYGKRYGTAFADQVDGNIMVGAVYPSLLKTDPRYFRLGRGSFLHRFGYGISRIFITRRDSGGSIFNIPEFAGNATAIAISTTYYPAADRSFSSSASNWGTQMAIDAFGNQLKEFWPDIHRRLARKKKLAPIPGPPQ